MSTASCNHLKSFLRAGGTKRGLSVWEAGGVRHTLWLIICAAKSSSHHFTPQLTATILVDWSFWRRPGWLIPHSSSAQRWWRPHQPRSACPRWGRLGNDPWSAEAAAWWSVEEKRNWSSTSGGNTAGSLQHHTLFHHPTLNLNSNLISKTTTNVWTVVLTTKPTTSFSLTGREGDRKEGKERREHPEARSVHVTSSLLSQ